MTHPVNAATPSSDPVDPADRNGTFRSESLEHALAAQDAAAVAFALRHDVVVVPKLVLPTDPTDAPSTGGPDDGTLPDEGDQVRVFGRENTDKRILLLLSVFSRPKKIGRAHV